MIHRLSIVLVAACAVVSASAETLCPFLNTATASGILGVSVHVTVIVGAKNKDDASCEFSSESGETILRVEVTTMSNWRTEFPAFLAQCGSNAATIRGIGNTAIACSGTTKEGKLYDQVLSRVRERSLLVRITSADKRAGPALREESTKAAGEIAGNLF